LIVFSYPQVEQRVEAWGVTITGVLEVSEHGGGDHGVEIDTKNIWMNPIMILHGLPLSSETAFDHASKLQAVKTRNYIREITGSVEILKQ
jgi:hypothetical protein